MTYYTILKDAKPCLEQYGIDVTRLVEVTGMSERETVSWLHHTVLPEYRPGDIMLRDAGLAYAEARKGLTVPEPIIESQTTVNGTITSTTAAVYEPGAWRNFYEAVVKNDTSGKLGRFIDQMKALVELVSRGPDGHLLAYEVTLWFLKTAKEHNKMELLSVVRHMATFDVLVRLGNKTNRIGVYRTNLSVRSFDADGFPIFGDEYVNIERGTPEYDRARAYSVDCLTTGGYQPTDNPDIFVDVTGSKAKIYDHVDDHRLRYHTVRDGVRTL